MDKKPALPEPRRANLLQRWLSRAAGLPAAIKKRATRKRVALLVGVLMIGANLTLAVVWMHVKGTADGKPVKPRPDYLKAALAALDRNDYSEAKRDALLARENGTLRPDESGGPSFVLGAVAAAESDNMWEEDQRRYSQLAARYFAEAQHDGWPRGRANEGFFLWGKSLSISRQYDASRAVLEQALAVAPERAGEIHWLAAQAYLWGTPAEPAKALAHVQAYLSDPGLTNRQRCEGLMLQSQVLFQQGKNEECLQLLARIPSDAPSFADATVLRGQLLMQAAAKLKAELQPGAAAEARRPMQQKYQEAIDTLRQAQNRGSSAQRVVPQSMYLIGECFMALDETRAALEQFRRTRQGFPESFEGVAAGFQEADLLRRLQQDDDSIAAYRQAVAAVGDPAEFRNPLLSADDIRRRVEDAFETYSRSGRFEKAIALATGLFPIFPRERQAELTAQAHRASADSLNEQADRALGAEARELARQAREQMRAAGAAYAQLATLQLAARNYTEDVWNSAECLLAGHDFRGAVRMLNEYLRYELRRRRPRALADLGEAELALEQFDLALESLHESIAAGSNDASSYRARLLAAKAHLEKGQVSEVEVLLRENLENGYLTPTSSEWRDSLFAYGSLLHASGRDDDATARLEEFVERYPDSPDMIQARYLAAESYRRSARVPGERLAADTIETSRIEHYKQMQQLLAAAIDQYDRIQEILTRRQEQSDLEPADRAILRNCYFARGDALFALNHYDEAIHAYSAAMNHYQHEPEVLEALVQIAACYRRLGKPDEARGTLAQAKVILARIPPDAPFTTTTNLSRDEWLRMLDWYAGL